MIVITAPHFVAGVVLFHGVVVRAAPILKYMLKWTKDQVESYCDRKRWTYEEVA